MMGKGRERKLVRAEKNKCFDNFVGEALGYMMKKYIEEIWSERQMVRH